MGELKSDKLRKQITEKFGSLTKFSKATGVSYKRVLRIVNTPNPKQSELQDLKEKCESFELDDDIYGLIDDLDRKVIRICILANYRSFTRFCEEHPQFNVVFITGITGRKKSRAKVCKDYSDLLNLLKKKYKYDEFTAIIRK